MTKKYSPLYAKGEIIVGFRKLVHPNIDLAEMFAQAWGYKVKEGTEFYPNAFIYLTDPGKEQEAIDFFLGKTEFIEWAERRDLRLESRWKDLEHCINELRQIDEDAGQLSSEDYNIKLQEMIEQLTRMQEK